MNRLKTVTVANIRKLGDHECVKVGDFLQFIPLEDCEVANNLKKFAGKMVEVLQINKNPDEFSFLEFKVQDADGNVVVAPSREFSRAYREISK